MSPDNAFNAKASKDKTLLEDVCRARKMVEVCPSLTESIHGLSRLRNACAYLAEKTGGAYTAADLGEAINKDKAEYPVTTAKESSQLALYADKKASEAFGLLSALLDTDDKGHYRLARMENTQRLRICMEAEQAMTRSVLLQLRSVRVPENNKRKPRV